LTSLVADSLRGFGWYHIGVDNYQPKEYHPSLQSATSHASKLPGRERFLNGC
jgi:hypothetical protein